MMQRNVEITTEDGTSTASLHVPEGEGPWPAAILYPDAGGLRDTLRNMAERLTSLGYVTLVPDIYYRSGGFAPFDLPSAFGDPAELERLMGLVRSVTADMAIRDARAQVGFLTALPETTGEAVGTTGYCIGGRLSLLAAGSQGDRVAAAAAFHAGSLAAADQPGSPHLLAGAMTATVYVGAATGDASFPPDQHDRLEQALTAAGVTHTIETYPAEHGFAVPDNPHYDPAAAERHWDALANLFSTSLPNP
jgi:carboxymethylenebutenolidase